MLNRVFTKREKVLLVILAVICLAALYYYFIQLPISQVVPTADSVVDSYNAESGILNAKYVKMQEMQAELDSMKEADKQAEIPDYDNLSPLISFLDGVLTGKDNYSATFSEPVKGDDGIARRSVSLTFQAASYESATDAIAKLQNCRYLCRVDNVSIAPLSGTGSITTASPLKVTVSIIYYESIKVE